MFMAIEHLRSNHRSDVRRALAADRRAIASLELADFVQARRDLTSAAKLEPKNREVRTKLSACKEAADEQRQKERALYAAMIGGATDKPTPAAQAHDAATGDAAPVATHNGGGGQAAPSYDDAIDMV
jgi:hypothetical protein